MKAIAALGLLSLATAVACSSAPSREMGAEGAALNVGLGVAAAPLHRAVTGCFTPCEYGTTCDEKTGVCVKQEEPAKPVTSAFPEGSPPASASAGPAVAPPPPTGVAPLCSPACPVDHTCEMEAGRSICKRR